MMKKLPAVAALLLALTATAAVAGSSSSSSMAALPPITYVNAATAGPQVIVLPGEIKTTNNDFKTKFTGDNIADWAELELGKANFRVLERSDLSSIMQELQTAYSLGDPDAVKKYLKKGKLKSTKYILKFDILKAEMSETKASGFNGASAAHTVTSVARAFNPFAARSGGGAAADAVAGSVQTESVGGTWVIGMRYKIIDASTTEQLAQGYQEDTVDVGGSSTTVAGISAGRVKMLTLDSVVQRLVQENVADIDSKHK
jgi:hypothetical protein